MVCRVPLKFAMKTSSMKRLGALTLLGLSGLALVGCGSGNSNNNTPQNVPAANIVALTSNNALSFFDARTPYTVSTRFITGLNAGEQVLGIDYRFAPLATATTGSGLYGLVRTGTVGSSRLIRIDLSNNGAAATTVGTPFTLPFTGINIGFDFNPLVDRIRVVDSTSRTNLRINPDTGALVDTDTDTTGFQGDTAVAYDASDAGNGTTPRLAGAAYTNNFVGTTSTINYAIDTARGVLVTQGRPANASVPGDTAVSPNTGRLFTVGTLTGAVVSGSSAGFDIAPTSNNAYVAYTSNGSPRLYGLDLATGAGTGGGNISIGGNGSLLGIAVLP